MVTLLNYMPWIITIIGGYFIFRQCEKFNQDLKDSNDADSVTHSFIKKLVFTVLLTGGAVLGFNISSNSFIGKSIESKTTIPIPEFETSADTIVDRLRKPEVRTDSAFNEMVDWKKK